MGQQTADFPVTPGDSQIRYAYPLFCERTGHPFSKHFRLVVELIGNWSLRFQSPSQRNCQGEEDRRRGQHRGIVPGMGNKRDTLLVLWCRGRYFEIGLWCREESMALGA